MHHHFFSRIVIHQHNFIQMEFSSNNTESIRTDGPKLSDDFYIIKAQIPIPVAETSLQTVERNKAVMSLSGFKIPGGQCASGIPFTLKAYIQIHRTGQVRIPQGSFAVQILSVSEDSVSPGIHIIIAPGCQDSAKHFCMDIRKPENPIGIVHIPDDICKMQCRNMQFLHFNSSPAHRPRNRSFHSDHYRHIIMDIHAKAQGGRIHIPQRNIHIQHRGSRFKINFTVDGHTAALHGSAKFPGGQVNMGHPCRIESQLHVNIVQNIMMLFIAGSQLTVL